MPDAPIKTFELEFIGLPNRPKLELAIGYTTLTKWSLVHPTESEGEYESREWTILTVTAVADPAPSPMLNGNPVISLKNYSENEGLLERLEASGIVQYAGRTYEQGFVRIPLVEVLVPEENLIHHCANEKCCKWEVLGQARYKRCSKCQKTYYCSEQCQCEDWKVHKTICRTLARGDNLTLLNKQRAEMSKMLDGMGFQKVMLDGTQS